MMTVFDGAYVFSLYIILSLWGSSEYKSILGLETLRRLSHATSSVKTIVVVYGNILL